MKSFSVSPFIIACSKLLVFFVLFAQIQEAAAQSGVKISGTVVDRQSKEPVPFVHVYTKSLSAGTATDEKGKFIISINHADTLVFSAVGFDKYFFSLRQEEVKAYYDVVIELDFKTYELEPVKVTAYKDVEQFKKDILNLNIPTKQKEFSLDIPKGATILDDHPVLDNGGSLGGVSARGAISALAYAISRDAKEQRKLEVLKRESGRRRLVQSKYNIEVVKNVTSLNEEGALRFMEWCKFDDEFVLNSSEYEITVAMLKCLDEFSKNDTIN